MPKKPAYLYENAHKSPDFRDVKENINDFCKKKTLITKKNRHMGLLPRFKIRMTKILNPILTQSEGFEHYNFEISACLVVRYSDLGFEQRSHMAEENKKKRVLITGCSSGFGMLTAIEAAKNGFECIATMRNIEKAAPLKHALQRENLTATIDTLDVTDRSAIDAIAKKYAPVDILINNAGILITGSFLDITDAEAARVFETNYFGAVAMTRAFAPSMMEQKSGLIINVASLAGLAGHMFNAAYSASKHALVGFSRSIKTELRPFNVKVVSLEPGYHKTEIIGTNANVAENLYDPDSPMYDYSRGFLNLMLKKVIPAAGDPQVVVDTILKIMLAEKPKPHYVLGKDARLITAARWLGLLPLLEKEAYKRLLRATRQEKRRTEARQKKRKPTT